MTKNVTLKLDDSILRKARHLAVERDQSLSQWVAELIIQRAGQEETHRAARDRALKRLAVGLPLGGRAMSREEAHER